MSNQDQHIILDKELRRDLDAILQRLKQASTCSGSMRLLSAEEMKTHQGEATRFSAERTEAKLKIVEAIMWLGMDLKAINDESAASLPSPYLCGSCKAPTPYPLISKVCPSCGGDIGTNGGPLDNPAFLAAKDGLAASPYPNSKDPSNTVIDPTADGLKL